MGLGPRQLRGAAGLCASACRLCRRRGGNWPCRRWRTAVGWFPLAPGETYWPSYTRNVYYIRNVNVTNVKNINNVIQSNGAPPRQVAKANFANRRFATVVPQRVFANADPVAPAAIHVPTAVLEKAPVVVHPPQVSPVPRQAIAARAPQHPRSVPVGPGPHRPPVRQPLRLWRVCSRSTHRGRPLNMPSNRVVRARPLTKLPSRHVREPPTQPRAQLIRPLLRRTCPALRPLRRCRHHIRQRCPVCRLRSRTRRGRLPGMPSNQRARVPPLTRPPSRRILEQSAHPSGRLISRLRHRMRPPRRPPPRCRRHIREPLPLRRGKRRQKPSRRRICHRRLSRAGRSGQCYRQSDARRRSASRGRLRHHIPALPRRLLTHRHRRRLYILPRRRHCSPANSGGHSSPARSGSPSGSGGCASCAGSRPCAAPRPSSGRRSGNGSRRRQISAERRGQEG